MKKYLQSLVLLFILIFSFTSSYANHIRGCDLRYVWVSGNTYTVILTVYGDCAVTTPSLSTSRPVICTYNGSTFVHSDTLTIQAPSSGTNVSQVCAADTALTTCNVPASTIPGTKKYVYSKNITLTGSSHFWRFIFCGNMAGSSAGRASSITNITPAGSTIIQLVDTLDNTYHNNSSPDLTAIATPYFCVNNPDFYSPAAVDANGDSLHFALVAAVNNSSASCSGTSTAGAVTYIGGTSASAPIQSTSAFSFSSANGQVTFTTNTTQNALVVYNIEEYRNDTFIGTCQREMSFIVQTCTEPPPAATLSSPTNGVIVDSTHFEICQNTGAFQFNLNPTETDTTYAIYVSAAGVPAGATFTVTNDSTNHPTSVFSWTSATTPGVYTFYVTYRDNACPIAGINTVAYTITIDAPPSPITGTLNVCTDATTTLTDAPAGGTWSASNGNASINATTGLVTGVSPGLDTVTYSYSVANCSVTAIVTVNQTPTPITGTMNVCVGQTTSLSSTPSGGTWTSSATGIATVGSTGIVTGGSAGTSNISYTMSTGCAVGTTVTVNPLPTAITGTLSICVGATTTLNSTPAGGLWTSGNPAVATIDPFTGVATGISPGIAMITYTVGSGCVVTAPLTVNTTPSAITPSGPVSICLGSATSLADGTPGGVWSSSSISVATVGSTGTVTGAGLGTATISYALGTCSATKQVTVIATPAAISPISSTVCTGTTTTLSDATPGGTWTSANAAIASVSSGGIVSGVSVGSTTITYTVGSCFVTATVTVNLTPASITPSGPVSMCVGASASLADATPGGVWSSGSTGIATVGTGGSVTGVSAGVATISYTVSGCSATKAVTVLTTPVAISPASTSVCVGSTTTLTDLTGGGSWTSSTPGVATIGSSTGIVTGVTAGTATITYTIGTCFVISTVTVNANPAAITPSGPISICVGATTTLGDATPGGTWSSGATGIATVGTGGLVTGISSGTVNISYTNAGGCSAVKAVTIAVTPAAISPLSSNVCIAATETLTNSVGGGTWVSSATSVATIGSSSGIVTGVAAGSTTITYSIGSCATTATVTVSPAANPGTISGPSNVCVGSTISLTDAASGGVWSSNNITIATVGSTGIVTGINGGISGNVATISYSVTNFCGTVSATHTVNVVPSGVQPITGLSILCAGTFTTYSDATPGGTWSVTNADATITGTGLLTGVSPGTDTIRYSVTNVCGTFGTTKVVTIGPYLTAGTITGPTSLCAGTTITLSDLAPSGTWSASNGHATVSGGVVTGVSGGVDTIMYTTTSSCGSAVASHPVTVNPLPDAGTISGPSTICAGMFVTYSDTSAGGVWSLTNTTMASISGSGVVTAISTGTDTIKYTVTNTCGTSVTTKVITIGAFLTAGSISGPSSVCAGSTITLTDPASGGVWSSSNTSLATAGTTGIVTGVAGGVDTILYTVSNACGTVSASHTVTVNPLPNAGSITGPSTICIGSVTAYTDTASGGTWSATNGHATVTGTGSVTAVSAGTDTLVYTVTNGCGTATATKIITIGATVTAGTITGPGNVCIGSSITLSDAAGGGVWSSSATGIATVGTSGTVTGVSSGTATISYTVSNSCGTATATTVVTVSPVAVAGSISGPSTLCVGSVALYTDAASGGVWSVSNGTATITGGGLVSAITTGTDTINYTVTTGCGSATATKVISLLPATTAGTITGPSSVCVGSVISLTDGASGGVWSASNGTATVGSTGIVTGITAGTDTIMYSVVGSCGAVVATHVVTVSSGTSISAISGPSAICVGALATLTDATPGGAWSASNAHATVTTSGVLTGITPGVDTISYTEVGACGVASVIKIITVNLLPSVSPIVGASVVCQGSSIILTDATPGGVWSASNGTATVGLATGIVTGITAGVDTIIYTSTSSCGTVSTTTTVTVNPLPNAGTISGPDSLCIGAAITLTDAAPGGVWSAGNANATVSSGLVIGVSAGTDPISYTVTNSCGSASAVQIVNVVPFPTSGSITGSSSVCVGAGITLFDASPGGTWVASNGNALVVGPGIIDGVTVGVDTIYYIVSNSCGTSSASKVINVNPVPFVAPISGPGMQCTATTVSYTDAVPGGVWNSSNPAVATIGISSGVATGIGVGTTTITYTVTNAFGCPNTVTTTDTVVAIPVIPAIAGGTNACLGATTALSDSVGGGTWSSSNPSIATIDAATGVVTGVSTGTVIITYTVVNMCGTTMVTRAEVVNPLPSVASITGTTHQCQGATSTLADATAGGVWVSNNTAIATVGSATGIVTGVAAGTTNINYLYTSPLGCTVVLFVPDTVIAAPAVAAISGTLSECVGATATATDATAGGTWSSANPVIATVGAGTGIISGVTAGVVNINYSVTNILGCTTTVSASDTVMGGPVVPAILGGTNVCVGATLTLTDTMAGGTWSAANGNATVSGGVVTGVTPGADTIIYTVVGTCGTGVASMPIMVNTIPTISTITGASNVCIGSSVMLADTTAGGIWSASNSHAAVDSAGMVSGMTAGVDTIIYAVSSTCGTAFAITEITVQTVPASAGAITGASVVCNGASITLADTTAGGVWTASNSRATVSSAGVVTGVASGADTIRYTVSNTCGSTTTSKVVTIATAPSAGVISGGSSLCAGLTLSLSDLGGATGGTWTSSNSTIATVSSGGVVSGVAAGSVTISYTVANVCGSRSATHAVTVLPAASCGAGVGTVNVADEIKIYPNPASTVLQIDASVKINVAVLSVDGKMLIRQNNANAIDVSNLAEGLYIVMIYDENGVLLKTAKFAKAQ